VNGENALLDRRQAGFREPAFDFAGGDVPRDLLGRVRFGSCTLSQIMKEMNVVQTNDRPLERVLEVLEHFGRDGRLERLRVRSDLAPVLTKEINRAQ
jgi:hypothetical protein